MTDQTGYTLNEYQLDARKTANYKHPHYPFFALAEEAGEVSGKVAKSLRKTGILDTDGLSSPYAEQTRAALKKELGDVLWQLQQCCTEMGFTLEEVAHANIDKLADRAERNVIDGEGDNR